MAALPDYKTPPVIEVAMGTQFAPLADLTTAHVGIYWALIRSEFGSIQEQPPIVHIVEQLGSAPRGSRRPIGIEVQTKPDLLRTWFVDGTGNRIIQLQRDRFLHNWRKVKEADEYPRFPSVRDAFKRYWDQFHTFLAAEGLPLPQVDQCELTYVNHIRKGRAWESMADLSDVFTTFQWQTRAGFLPDPDNIRWLMQFSLPDKMGRLHVEVFRVLLPPDNAQAIRFALTARGRPPGDLDQSRIDQWFELAREWIVKGFADLVGKKMDALWEKLP